MLAVVGSWTVYRSAGPPVSRVRASGLGMVLSAASGTLSSSENHVTSLRMGLLPPISAVRGPNDNRPEQRN